MTKWKMIPDEDSNERVFMMPNNTVQDPVSMLENYIIGAEKIKRLLKEEKKDKEEDKKKPKTYTKSDVTCWSLLLLASAPWTGLWILHALDSAKAQWAQVLLNSVK